MGGSPKRRASIGFGSAMIGLKPMWPRMSRSMSIPGATSVSSMPAGVRRNTQRSVTVKHRLAGLGRIGAAERDLLDRLDKLARLSFAHDLQPPVLDCDLQPARRQRTGE